MASRPVSKEARSKPILRVKTVKPRSARTSSERAAVMPTYSNQQSQERLQSAVHSAVMAIQSLLDHNNSRFETFTRASQALDRNTNVLTSFENERRPNDLERDIAVEEIPPDYQSDKVIFLDEPTSPKHIDEPTSPKHIDSPYPLVENPPPNTEYIPPGAGSGGDVPIIKPPISYRGQTLVEVKVVFVRILDIDTASQQFEAEIYIQARWTESQFSGYSEEELQEIEFHQCWDPWLIILNNVGSLETERASMLLRYEPERVYPVLTYMWHVQGIFRETMELQHFPFDVQEIGIVLSSERSVKEIELVCDYTQLSNVSPRAMQGNQEWTVYRHVEFIRDYNTLETFSTVKHPVLVAAAHVKRKLAFYFWNIYLIVLLILGLSFTVLGIVPYLEERLMIIVTLFLTAVVFKLIVRMTLPYMYYVTYLDVYVVFALIFLALQAVENSIMIHLKKFKSPAKIEFYDEIAQGCLIALLVVFHLVLIVYIQLTAFSRRRSVADKELDYEITKMNLNKAAEQQVTREQNTCICVPMPENRQEPIQVENPLFTTQ